VSLGVRGEKRLNTTDIGNSLRLALRQPQFKINDLNVWNISWHSLY